MASPHLPTTCPECFIAPGRYQGARVERAGDPAPAPAGSEFRVPEFWACPECASDEFDQVT